MFNDNSGYIIVDKMTSHRDPLFTLCNCKVFQLVILFDQEHAQIYNQKKKNDRN